MGWLDGFTTSIRIDQPGPQGHRGANANKFQSQVMSRQYMSKVWGRGKRKETVTPERPGKVGDGGVEWAGGFQRGDEHW